MGESIEGFYARLFQSIEPAGDLLARPAVFVVQVNEDGGQAEALLAAIAARALADRAFKAIEEPFQVLGRPRTGCIRGQAVHPLVSRPEGAGGVLAAVVIAVGWSGRRSAPARMKAANSFSP